MNKSQTSLLAAVVIFALAAHGQAQDAMTPPRPTSERAAPMPDPLQGQPLRQGVTPAAPLPIGSAPPTFEPGPFPSPPLVLPPEGQTPPDLTPLSRLGNGDGALLDNGRSMAGMGIEALALGDGMASRPRIGYTLTWYPEEATGAHGSNLSIFRQDFRFSTPLYKDDCNVVSLSAGVRNEMIDTDALLPVLGLPFPDDLWNVHLGAGYQHQFDNGWTAGLNAHVGSASDDPFANINQITVGATASLRIPVREHDAWIFTLTYSNNTDFANNIPIPGVAYLFWPNDSFQALIGIPFARVWYRPFNKIAIDLSYRFPYTVQGRVAYQSLFQRP